MFYFFFSYILFLYIYFFYLAVNIFLCITQLITSQRILLHLKYYISKLILLRALQREMYASYASKFLIASLSRSGWCSILFISSASNLLFLSSSTLLSASIALFLHPRICITAIANTTKTTTPIQVPHSLTPVNKSWKSLNSTLSSGIMQ